MAFMNVFDVDVARNIHELIPRRPDVDWEAVEGAIFTYNHIVIYNGGPEGGYVYFYTERRPGWYKWEKLGSGASIHIHRRRTRSRAMVGLCRVYVSFA